MNNLFFKGMDKELNEIVYSEQIGLPEFFCRMEDGRIDEAFPFVTTDKNGDKVFAGDMVDVSMSFEGGTLPHRGVIVYDKKFGAFGTKNEAGITLLHNHCMHTLELIKDKDNE